MKRFVVLDKKIGHTPLETITLWKQAHPKYASLPATYAGRLDPLASGKLLVLLGEECKRKDAYTGLDKEYEVSILLDLATDTGDLLGMPRSCEQSVPPSKKEILRVLNEQLGTRSHAYPLFSSKTVDGVPLFMHALNGTEVTAPTHPETIHRIVLRDIRSEDSETIQAYIEKALSVVPRDDRQSKGLGQDFRQDAIRTAWTSLFDSAAKRDYCVIRVRVVCGTGTYMRTLAERIGESLGTLAVAASIHRTRIGIYKPGLFGGLWLKQF